jgi:hypothetical protein
VTRKPLHNALFVAIVLWCALLAAGALILAFIGMLFASEPGGGGMGAYEYFQALLPLLQTAALFAVLIILWRKGYYILAFIAWLMSVIFVVYQYHGWLL